jgi:hypothetical protein
MFFPENKTLIFKNHTMHEGKKKRFNYILLIYSTFAYYNLLRSGGGYPGERGTGRR